MLREAPDPLRLIVLGHVGCILAWSSSMGYWLSHVWQSVLTEIQFINPVIRTTIESVKCFFHTELMSVWLSTAILINCAVFFSFSSFFQFRKIIILCYFPPCLFALLYSYDKVSGYELSIFFHIGYFVLVPLILFQWGPVTFLNLFFPWDTYTWECTASVLKYAFTKPIVFIPLLLVFPDCWWFFSKSWSLISFHFHVLNSFYQLIRNNPRGDLLFCFPCLWFPGHSKMLFLPCLITFFINVSIV